MSRAWHGSSCRAGALIALAAALSVVLPARGETDVERLTLDRALEIAFERNRTLEIRELEVGKAEERLAATRTHRYPVFQVDVNGNKPLNSIEFGFERGIFGEFPGIGPIPSTDTQVTRSKDFNWFLTATLAQPLLQQYQVGLGVKLAKLDVEVRRQRSRQERLQVASRVREAYDTVLQARSSLDAAMGALEFFEELERVVTDQVDREAALPSDLLEVRSKRAGAEYQVRVATHAVDNSREQLNLLLGRDIGTRFEVEELPPPGPLEADVDGAVARALENRPDLSEARLQLSQATLDRRLTRAEQLPDLNLTLSNYSFDIEFLPRNIQTIGLVLSWKPSDFGKWRHEAAEKNLTITQAGKSVVEAEESVRVEVGALIRALEDARGLIDVRDAERAAAKEKTRVLASRHKAEAALLEDLLQAQADQARTEDDWRQAVLAFWSTRARFQRAIGEE